MQTYRHYNRILSGEEGETETSTQKVQCEETGGWWWKMENLKPGGDENGRT